MANPITIRIYPSEQGGWMYDIYDEDLIDLIDADEPDCVDGGHCTSNLVTKALGMAVDTTQQLLEQGKLQQ